MYEELVKRLRELPLLLFVQLHGHEDVVNQAADALEELSKLADAIPHICECCIGCEVESGGCDNAFVLSPKRAREYLNKSRLISATTGLPDEWKSVLTCVTRKCVPLPEPPKEANSSACEPFKHCCNSTGKVCELATEFGYCKVTVCTKRYGDSSRKWEA